MLRQEEGAIKTKTEGSSWLSVCCWKWPESFSSFPRNPDCSFAERNRSGGETTETTFQLPRRPRQLMIHNYLVLYYYKIILRAGTCPQMSQEQTIHPTVCCIGREGERGGERFLFHSGRSKHTWKIKSV